jgi:hypothetical protein
VFFGYLEFGFVNSDILKLSPLFIIEEFNPEN